VLEPGARGLRVSRSYSKNLLTAAEQKRRDRVDIRKGLGDRRGIHSAGSDRARRRATSAPGGPRVPGLPAEHGRTEREAGRRERRRRPARGSQSRRQAQDVRAEKVRRAGRRAVARPGVAAPERMSAVELARAAEQHGVSVKGEAQVREVAAEEARERQAARGAGGADEGRGLPRSRSARGGRGVLLLRPERELLVPAAKQLLGDVRSSPAEVARRCTARSGGSRTAYQQHGAEMDLAGGGATGRGSGRCARSRPIWRRAARPGRGRRSGLRGLLQRAEQYRRVAANVSREARRGRHADGGAGARGGVPGLRGVAVRGQGVRYDETRAPTDADAAAYGAREGQGAVGGPGRARSGAGGAAGACGGA
jgi:hypothetical protein